MELNNRTNLDIKVIKIMFIKFTAIIIYVLLNLHIEATGENKQNLHFKATNNHGINIIFKYKQFLKGKKGKVAVLLHGETFRYNSAQFIRDVRSNITIF